MRLEAEHVHLRRQVASPDEVFRYNLVARRIAPGLDEVPAWEQGGELHLLRDRRLAGRPASKAFSLAAEHALGGPVQVERRTTRQGAVLWLLRHGHPWVGTWIFDLERWVQEHTDQWFEPQVGLLCTVPTRSTLYVHLLNTSPQVLPTAAGLALLGAGGFAQPPVNPDVAGIRPAPDPVSPEVYWIRRGAIRHLPTEVDLSTGAVQVHPTEAFTRDVLGPLTR